MERIKKIIFQPNLNILPIPKKQTMISETLISIIGFSAGLFTMLANFPQLIKILKEKHTNDISFLTYLMLDLGFILWVLYGLYQKDYPIIIANGISFIIAFLITILKIKK
jgi:MtN3 and saliva related transmembrane protein